MSPIVPSSFESTALTSPTVKTVGKGNGFFARAMFVNQGSSTCKYFLIQKKQCRQGLVLCRSRYVALRRKMR